MSEFAERITSSRLFATRGGTIAVGAFAALLALPVLLLYLSHYRSSLRSSGAPVPVLVATHLIPQGTAGDVLGTNDGFAATQVARSAVKEGAITDPAALKGKVAVADVYPGQQLTVADFTATATYLMKCPQMSPFWDEPPAPVRLYGSLSQPTGAPSHPVR